MATIGTNTLAFAVEQSANYVWPAPTTAGTDTYVQRVFDSGTNGWCYYTKTTIDPTPSSGETTPNYTGSISGHTVLAIIPP